MCNRLIHRGISRLVLDTTRDGLNTVVPLRHDSHRIELALVIIVGQFVFDRFAGFCVFEESVDFRFLVGAAVVEREDWDIESILIMQLGYILLVFPIPIEISLRRSLVIVGFSASPAQSLLQCIIFLIGPILRMEISSHRHLRLVDELLEFRFVLRDEPGLLGERTGDMAELAILRLEFI